MWFCEGPARESGLPDADSRAACLADLDRRNKEQRTGWGPKEYHSSRIQGEEEGTPDKQVTSLTLLRKILLKRK